jgi:DNA-binding XRE family transcriptional regulator
MPLPKSRRIYPDLHAFFRDDLNPTATQIAKEVGCSKPFLSCIKWRTRQPSLPLALRIADRCNVPLESLLWKPNLTKKAS